MVTESHLSGYAYRFEPGSAEDAPVLLLLHGTGGTETDLVPFARLAAPAAHLLSPRGNVLENGAPRFFRRVAEGVFDLEDLRLRTEQLGRFIAEAAERHAFPMSRVVALGFSNGANIAASLMLTDPAVLRHAILLRATLPFEPDTRPDLRGSSALIAVGRSDRITAPANGERLAAAMRDAGARVEIRWQDAGHGLVSGDVSDSQAFLQALSH